MMPNIAILLAGGSGKRAGSEVPKQFLKIKGKTILEYSVEKFDTMPLIDEITVVVHPNWLSETEELLQQGHFRKVKHILTGGAERYHSVLAALEIYRSPCHILIHDAVRPLVSHRIIKEVIDSLATYKAVDVAIPATDTIIQTDSHYTLVTAIPDRKYLYQVQTPQGFCSGTLQKAYRLALADPNFSTTDDCGVIKKYLPDEKIYIVKGEVSNIKFTYPEDLSILEFLLQQEIK